MECLVSGFFVNALTCLIVISKQKCTTKVSQGFVCQSKSENGERYLYLSERKRAREKTHNLCQGTTYSRKNIGFFIIWVPRRLATVNTTWSVNMNIHTGSFLSCKKYKQVHISNYFVAFPPSAAFFHYI